jgi:hypothetical protein
LISVVSEAQRKANSQQQINHKGHKGHEGKQQKTSEAKPMLDAHTLTCFVFSLCPFCPPWPEFLLIVAPIREQAAG